MLRTRLCDSPAQQGTGLPCSGSPNSTAPCQEWECGQPREWFNSMRPEQNFAHILSSFWLKIFYKFDLNLTWTNVVRFLIKTLNVRGQSHLGLTRSISWLLMPWLLTSPGHQQPWHWLHRICRCLSYLRKDFKYLCQINVEEWQKMQIYVYVLSEKFST